MAGKVEAAGFVIHAEHRDVVSALIATIEEPAGGIEVKAAWIAAACAFFTDKSQDAVWPNGKNRDAVVQPVAGVDKPAVAGNKDLRAEIAAGKSAGQSGDRLP